MYLHAARTFFSSRASSIRVVIRSLKLEKQLKRTRGFSVVPLLTEINILLSEVCHIGITHLPDSSCLSRMLSTSYCATVTGKTSPPVKVYFPWGKTRIEERLAQCGRESSVPRQGFSIPLRPTDQGPQVESFRQLPLWNRYWGRIMRPYI